MLRDRSLKSSKEHLAIIREVLRMLLFCSKLKRAICSLPYSFRSRSKKRWGCLAEEICGVWACRLKGKALIYALSIGTKDVGLDSKLNKDFEGGFNFLQR